MKNLNPIIVAFIVLCLQSYAHPSSGQVHFEDSFEYNDSVTNHGWIFYPFGDDASVYTTSSKVHTGSRSLFMDSRDDDEQRIAFTFNSRMTNVIVEVFMYDDMQPYGFNLLAVGIRYTGGAGSNHALIGFRSPLSGTHYSTEAGTLPSWEVTTMPRTTGWQKLALEVTPAGLKYYINDFLVRTSGHLTEIDFIQLACGNHGYGPAIGTVYFDDIKVTVPQLEVLVDIKPGSDPNSINLKSKGVIPVAILTTSTTQGEPLDFDATTVDPLSVEFGPDGALESRRKGHIEDVDGDGDADLVLHFKTQETGIQCGDTEVSLTGQTFDGQDITGKDAIQTVGCKLPKLTANENYGIPEGFALFQNHPNPFNPTTQITYDLPQNGHVRIEIYDLLGSHIRTLVKENQASGVMPQL